MRIHKFCYPLLPRATRDYIGYVNAAVRRLREFVLTIAWLRFSSAPLSFHYARQHSCR